MDADERRKKLNELTHAILGAAMEVSNEMGCGFLEKNYERALVHELQLRGIRAEAQKPMKVFYKGVEVGDYFADIVVEDCVIVELKCVDAFSDVHMAQCLNYLIASNLHVALLINFQKPRLDFKRIVRDF